jgi:hypothetical protein
MPKGTLRPGQPLEGPPMEPSVGPRAKEGDPFGPPPKGDFRPQMPKGEGDPGSLVRRLHELVRQAEERGLDVAKARQLDEASLDAAQRGDWQENRRLLEEALRSIRQTLGLPERPPAPDGPTQPGPKARRGGEL